MPNRPRCVGAYAATAQSATVVTVWRRSGVLLPLIGCAGAVAPGIANQPRKPPPQIPHESYSVVPAELGDVGALARIHHRVWVRRYGRVWFGAQDVDPITDQIDNRRVPVLEKVIGETRQRIRIVVDADREAIYAAWIPRADAVPAALREVELDGKRAAVLDPGAPLEVVETRGDERRVALLNDDVAIGGWLDAKLIGDVWLGPGARRPHDGPRELLEKAAIHETASAGSPIVAIANARVAITELGPERGGWIEVALERHYARVHGFARALDVQTPTELSLHSIGGGSGFGISDTDHADVTAGACLFDRAEGEVIGVNTKQVVRYAYRPSAAHPGWWTVFVGSHWGALRAYVHDLGGDPAVPKWESCASGP